MRSGAPAVGCGLTSHSSGWTKGGAPHSRSSTLYCPTSSASVMLTLPSALTSPQMPAWKGQTPSPPVHEPAGSVGTDTGTCARNVSREVRCRGSLSFFRRERRSNDRPSVSITVSACTVTSARRFLPTRCSVSVATWIRPFGPSRRRAWKAAKRTGPPSRLRLLVMGDPEKSSLAPPSTALTRATSGSTETSSE